VSIYCNGTERKIAVILERVFALAAEDLKIGGHFPFHPCHQSECGLPWVSHW